MTNYTASVLDNQVSISDIINNLNEEKEEQASIGMAAGMKGESSSEHKNVGDCLVLPNWNTGFRQTKFATRSYLHRINPKTKQMGQVPIMEMEGELQPEYLPTICPLCNSKLHKHGSRAIWIDDVPLGSTRTRLHVDRDRYICSNEECNYSTTPKLPFAMEEHRVTKALEAFVCDLLEYGLILKNVSQITGLSPHIIKDIDKARLSKLYLDEDGKLKRPEEYARYVGVDEFLLHEGYHFATVFMDLETGHVLYLTEGKKKAGIDKFMDFVGDDWMKHVEAIACDMNADFGDAFQARYPDIDVVFDFFHIVKNFNDKVMSPIRIEEQAQLLATGNEDAAKELKGSRSILNSNLETLEERDQEGRDEKVANKGSDIFDIPESKHQESHREERLWTILENNELLLRAYIIKELLRAAYKCTTVESMEQYLIEIILLCQETDNKHLRWFSKLIGRHWDGIVNHAVYGISSGIVEGTNRKIKTIRWQSYGYPDDEYFFLKIIDATR